MTCIFFKMIAFADPAHYLKFSVILDEQTTGKCCSALENGCISLMDKAGVSSSTSYDSQ